MCNLLKYAYQGSEVTFSNGVGERHTDGKSVWEKTN